MLGQSSFYATGPAEIRGDVFSVNTGDLGSNSQKYQNLYLTGTGNADAFSSRLAFSQEARITGLSVSNLYPVGQPNLGHANQRWNDLYATGVGYLDRIETKSQTTNSGVFDYLGPTGRFFPPILTFEQRTGIYAGSETPIDSAYDGMICYQYGASGAKFMAVQSGQWKTLALS